MVSGTAWAALVRGHWRGSLGGRFGAQIPDPMEFTGCTGFDWAMADFWY